jgi:hypothetical protein
MEDAIPQRADVVGGEEFDADHGKHNGGFCMRLCENAALL